VDKNAIVIAGPEGFIRFWNSAAETAFGHAAGEAIGQPLDLIVPPEFQDAHWIGFRRAIASGVAEAEGQNSPFPVRLASGEVEPRQARLSLIRAPDGQVVAAMVVFAQHPIP
jgi:PAS domain S-box-containing protein